jgi:hypothetical protein
MDISQRTLRHRCQVGPVSKVDESKGRRGGCLNLGREVKKKGREVRTERRGREITVRQRERDRAR